MSTPSFDVENDEIKAVMREIAGRIGGALPSEWGFLLMLMEYSTPDNGGATFYASSAERESVIKMLHEWLAKQGESVLVNARLPTRWREIVALVLLKYATSSEVVLTYEDFRALDMDKYSVAITEDDDGLRLSIVETEKTRALIAEGKAVES